MNVLVACLVALGCFVGLSQAGKSDLKACKYTADDGTVYDLSPLISKE